MKTALLFSGITLLLLIALFYYCSAVFRDNYIDLHISDTFIVLEYFVFVLGAVLILGTSFSLGGVLGTAFQKRSFLLLFLFFLLADAFVAWRYYTLFTS